MAILPLKSQPRMISLAVVEAPKPEPMGVCWVNIRNLLENVLIALAAVHRSSSPGFLFTTLNSSTPDVERFSQATRTPVLTFRLKSCSLFTLFTTSLLERRLPHPSRLLRAISSRDV